MTSTDHAHDNLTDICRQLDEAQRQFNALEMRPRESLRDFEYRVKSLTDLRQSFPELTICDRQVFNFFGENSLAVSVPKVSIRKPMASRKWVTWLLSSWDLSMWPKKPFSNVRLISDAKRCTFTKTNNVMHYFAIPFFAPALSKILLK